MSTDWVTVAVLFVLVALKLRDHQKRIEKLERAAKEREK